MNTDKKPAQQPELSQKSTRKSPWRFLFLAGAVLSGGWLMLYGSLFLLFDLMPAAFSPGEAASIGIIGGADGPTAIFVAGTVTRGFDWDLFIAAAILAVSILGLLLLRKCRQK